MLLLILSILYYSIVLYNVIVVISVSIIYIYREREIQTHIHIIASPTPRAPGRAEVALVIMCMGFGEL